MGLIVNVLDRQAFRELGDTASASDSGDTVLASCNECFGDMSAYLAAGLPVISTSASHVLIVGVYLLRR